MTKMTLSSDVMTVTLVVTLAVFFFVVEVSQGSPLSGLRSVPLTGGQDLRLYELHETTSWPFLEDCYNAHNSARQQHYVSELRLNRTLVDYARLKALILAWYDGSPPEEKEPNMFGENNSWNSTAPGPVNCTDVVAQWYGEGAGWQYPSESNNQEGSRLDDSNRHFAQVVWKRTRRFGCGQAVSRGGKGGTYTVCYYDPTAVAGKEKDNVLPTDADLTTTTTTSTTPSPIVEDFPQDQPAVQPAAASPELKAYLREFDDKDW